MRDRKTTNGRKTRNVIITLDAELDSLLSKHCEGCSLSRRFIITKLLEHYLSGNIKIELSANAQNVINNIKESGK